MPSTHICDWFVGYEKAHGSYRVGKVKTEKGKLEGQALTVNGPATREIWDAHLAGTGYGVGIIALLEENTVRWGALDIDKYNMDLAEISRRIANTPLILFRSKSGGAHLTCFVRDPVPAEDMVEWLAAMAAKLGWGGCEIFPKQTSRSSDADKGNWLNMPYFNAGMTMRYAIADGKALTLDECLDLIESKALSVADFADVEAGEGLEDLEAPPFEDGTPRTRRDPSKGRNRPEPTGERFNDGPPCLQHLAENGGFGSGVRNEGMFNVGVYCKKKWPNEWRDKIIDFRDMCNPPMDVKELHTTVEKSLGRKDYGYRCNQAPIEPHCNRRLCLKRQYGVGEVAGGGGKGASIGSLTKYEGSPVLWVIDIEGRRLELTTEELTNQVRFGQKCAEVLTRMPQPLPQSRWIQYLDERMMTADIVAPSEDEVTSEGHFWVLLERFCIQRAQGTSRDSVTTNYPYTTEGWTWFRGAALIDYLNRAGYKFKNNREIWALLEEKGGKKDIWDVRGTKVHVWGIKEFKEAAEIKRDLPDLGGEGEEF